MGINSIQIYNPVEKCKLSRTQNTTALLLLLLTDAIYPSRTFSYMFQLNCHSAPRSDRAPQEIWSGQVAEKLCLER